MQPGSGFAAAISTHPTSAIAVGEVIGQVFESVGEAPDLAVLFVSSHHLARFREIAAAVHHALRPGSMIGTAAASVIGNGAEVEGQPAISLWVGRTGPVVPFRLKAVASAGGFAVRGWPSPLKGRPATAILLADPFSFPIDTFIADVTERHPDLGIVGGLASVPPSSEGTRFVIDTTVHESGAVGVMIGNGCDVATLVSQGCRPVGEPFVVTRAERNVIYDLGGRPALERVAALHRGAPEEARSLLRSSLHLGVAVDPAKMEFERGDFLVRAVIGGDRESGAIALGEPVPIGTTVQFHVRDAETAHEDLEFLLAERCCDGRVEASLAFVCSARGFAMFGEHSHDAAMITSFTQAPMSGMSCTGEIGTVGHRSFLHGSAVSVALFRGR